MSAISLKSITGITSITTPSGADNQFTLHNNNTTEAVKLDTAGNLHFHNHLNITGISTAANFKTGTSNLHSTGLNIFDLDVDGHTNLDNVSIAGVTTSAGIVQASQFKLLDNAKAVYGSGADMEIYHNATNSLIQNGTGSLQIITTTGSLFLRGQDDISMNTGGNNVRLYITSAGRVGVNVTDPDSILETVSPATNGINAHIGGLYNDAGQTAVRRIEFGVKNYRNAIQSQQGSGGSNFSSDNDLLLNPSGGKIGIGTVNPDELLHIFSASGHSKIVLESDNNSALNGMFWVDEQDSTQTEFYYSHPDNKQFLKVNGNGFEIYSKQTNSTIAKIGSGLGYNNFIVGDGFVGINEDNPKTGLTIAKLGDYSTADGNTYYMPVGKWASAWNGINVIQNNTDYWVGFVGGYHKSSSSVNISLAPNRGNVNAQQGMYISGEATGNSTSDIAMGYISGGSATGAGTTGNVRATKVEQLRLRNSGKLNLGNTDLTQNTDQFCVSITANNSVDNVARFQSAAASSGTSESLVKVYKGAGYGGVISGYITQGSDHGMKLYTANNGTLTERLRINSTGHVTKASHPAFHARPPASYSTPHNTDTVIGGTWSTGDSESFVRGTLSNGNSIWDNSTGIFTVPVTGIYYFHLTLFLKDNTTRRDALIYHNGTGGGNIIARTEVMGQSGTGNRNVSVSTVVSLSVNDTIRFGARHTGSTATLYTNSKPWSYACGYLVG